MRMSARSVCLIVALAALVCAPAVAQKPEMAAGKTGEIPARGPGSLLYSQLGGASGNGAPAQDFEAAFDAYDSQGADDFVVTDPNWTIERVVVVGTQTAGNNCPGGVNVDFYADNAGVPAAAPTCSYPGAASTTAPGLDIVLPAGCVLPMGNHWMSIECVQAFGGGGGQFFWSNVSTASTLNNPGVWQNPLDGFATGCTTWTQQSTCGVGGGASDDYLFELYGLDVPVDLQSFDVE